MDAAILWRRLDRPGHDACTLRLEDGAWYLEGAAVWADRDGPAFMDYSVICGEDWEVRSARLQGRIGARPLTLSIRRGADDEWRVNGDVVPDSHGLRDLDLGFTPATNTIPLRRLAQTGEGASAAAWLDDSDWRLKPLHQTYRRAQPGIWDYTSVQHDFQARLTVDRNGFVTDYPGLWVKEG